MVRPDRTPRVIGSTPHVWQHYTNAEIDAEQWRTIPGLEGEYEASSLGRIRSLDREMPWFAARWGVWTTRKYRGQVIAKKVKPNGSGQSYYHIYTTGNKWRGTNRLVCSAFHGLPPSDRHEAAHLNGNSLDDRPQNLAWKTPVENAKDKVVHGTHPIGEMNGAAKMRATMILPIFEHFVTALSAEETAKHFRIGAHLVRNVVSRRSWVHVQIPDQLVELARRKAKDNVRAAQCRANEERHQAALQRVRQE